MSKPSAIKFHTNNHMMHNEPKGGKYTTRKSGKYIVCTELRYKLAQRKSLIKHTPWYR